SDMFVDDLMADVLKLLVYLGVMVMLVYSRPYIAARGMFRGKFFVLTLTAMLGMMVMASANHLLTLYLGLELLSLSLYAMVALQRDSAIATEAAMKYFVLGALASGMLLYGLSMLYGATGPPQRASSACVMRILVSGLGADYLVEQWQWMLIIMAVASLAIGNVVAIAQTNLKRMLAYSTISHMGFLLLGILSGSNDGFASAMFYVVVYVLMNLGAFGMILLLSRAGFEAENIDDFKGLNQRSPWYAFIMLLVMLSMAGRAPVAGFYAKLSVLWAVIDGGFLWLAVTAV